MKKSENRSLVYTGNRYSIRKNHTFYHAREKECCLMLEYNVTSNILDEMNYVIVKFSTDPLLHTVLSII